MNLAELGRFTAEKFQESFGHAPKWLAAAPGRVNIIGDHVDYNDGLVLPMAIERHTVIAAAPVEAGSRQVELRSAENAGKNQKFDLTQALKPLPKGSWANYPAGVMAGFMQRGIELPGFNAFIHTTVPIGGGLSSSAALEVATATLLERISGQTLPPVEKALLCQKAEHEFAGMPCGIMDQFISVMGQPGHLLLIDCRSRQHQLVPMHDESVSWLVIDSKVKHELGSSQYAVRRAQCEAAAAKLGLASLRDANFSQLAAGKSQLSEVEFRRARHVVTEIGRVSEAAQNIPAARWAETGKLLYASHDSLRDDYEVSCAEVDAIVEIARSIGTAGGMWGCRITGGGFGGCAVALVQSAASEKIQEIIRTEYRKKIGLEPALFVSRPAAGATMLSL